MSSSRRISLVSSFVVRVVLCAFFLFIGVTLLDFFPQYEAEVVFSRESKILCSSSLASGFLQGIQKFVRRTMGRSSVNKFASQFCKVEYDEVTIHLSSPLINLSGIPIMDVLVLYAWGFISSFALPSQLQRVFKISFAAVTQCYMLRLFSAILAENLSNRLVDRRFDCSWSLLIEILFLEPRNAEQSCILKESFKRINFPFSLDTIGSSLHHDIAMLVMISICCSLVYFLILVSWEPFWIFILFTLHIAVYIAALIGVACALGAVLVFLVIGTISYELVRTLLLLLFYTSKRMLSPIISMIAMFASRLAFQYCPEFAKHILWIILSEFLEFKLEESDFNSVLFRNIIEIFDAE